MIDNTRLSTGLLEPQSPVQNTKSIVSIMKEISTLTLQTFIGYFCLQLMNAISLHVLSKKGNNIQVAGYGFANLISSMLILPIGFGINQSLNQQTSQAIGTNNTVLKRIYLNFALWSQIIFLIPIFCIILSLKQSYAILLTENSLETTEVAFEVIHILMLAQMFALLFEALKVYSLSHQITKPFLIIHMVTTINHYLTCNILVDFVDSPLRAVAYSLLIQEIINQILLYIYLSKTDLFADFVPSMMIKEHYQLYLGFLKQTIPQVTHVLINDAGFLTLTIIAMRLGTDEFNAQLAFNNISTMYFRIPCSLALTLMSCISKELGASNVKNAKNYFTCGISLLLSFQIFLIFSIIMYKDMWTNFYAANQSVYNIIQVTLPVFVFGCFIFDGLQCALTGVLKGLNHGQLVSNLTLYCYLGIGIPGSMILARAFHLGVPGLWMGFGFANFILLIFFLHQLYYVDWSQKAKQIQCNQEDMNNKYLDKEWEMKVLSE